MAEIAVEITLQKLSDFLTEQAYFLFGVHERVTSLRNELELMRALLKDVDGKCRENERVKIWLGQVREVAYDAEDVIDYYIFTIEERRLEQTGLMSLVKGFARGIRDVPTIYDVGKKIGDIERRLDKIKERRSEYGINIPACGEASSSSNQSQRQMEKMAPIVEEADVVGIEDEAKTLVVRLTEGDARRAVISITGMGGIGKTTLAKKVYNNIHVKNCFNCHAWVYVSQEYRVRELLITIIDCFNCLSRDEIDKMSEADLRRELSGYLEGKRYLVVIDDIWSREAWESLVSAFPDRKKGSRVLLTTRKEEVAKHADAQSIPHKIRFLNESESWALFCKKALPGNHAPTCPPNLEELGRKMVAKCGGLPLAIAVLGGVLSRKEKSVNEWDKVLRSVVWWLHESKEDRISGILALSYHDLPYYLKPCFLYFGAFPEDSEISVLKLIQMWIAEGFVERRGEEEMEDVAEDYLEELISRSMIQAARRRSNGMARKCRIHDLLRDLAISKAEDERFFNVYRNIVPTSLTTARRLAITSADFSKSISLNRSNLHLRSLLHFGPVTPELKIPWGAFKLLRVMDLRNVRLSCLPDESGYLIHLRYLCLRNTELKRLPSTITCLRNLQTLDLRWTWIDIQPYDIWKMEQLRHLLLGSAYANTYESVSDCTHLQYISNLQTLKYVAAGRWMEDGLEKLTNLRDLRIRGDIKMALSRSFCKLVHLRSLWLRASEECSIPAFASFSNHQHLYKMKLFGPLETLPDLNEFPPNLTELCLYGSQLERDPMGTLEKLPNLRILTLESRGIFELEWYVYGGKEMVCSVGGFPQLRALSIKDVGIKEWRVEEGAMPNLRCLEINGCNELKMLPDGLQHVTSLQELHLVHMRLIDRVRGEGEDWFKVRHIPSLIIKSSGYNYHGESPPRGPVY